MAGTFNVSCADFSEELCDPFDFGRARRDERDSIFIRRVSRRLSHTEKLGWSVAFGTVLQPVGNVHVFGKAEQGQERAIELSNRVKVRNAKINVVETTHGALKLLT